MRLLLLMLALSAGACCCGAALIGRPGDSDEQLLDHAKVFLANPAVQAMPAATREQFFREKGLLTVDVAALLSPSGGGNSGATNKDPSASDPAAVARRVHHTGRALATPASLAAAVPHGGLVTTVALQAPRSSPPTTGTPTFDMEAELVGLKMFAMFLFLQEAYRFVPLFYQRTVHGGGIAQTVNDPRLFVMGLAVMFLWSAHTTLDKGLNMPRLVEIQQFR